MTEPGNKILHQEAPPNDILLAFGAVNLCWARLDALTSACLFDILSISPAEFICLIGQLDVIAKLRKIRKILELRDDLARSKVIDEIINKLGPIKSDRNTVTHGYYVGMSADGEIFITDYTQYISRSKNDHGTKMTVLDRQILSVHVQTVVDCTLKVFETFDKKRLQELLSLPSLVPIQSNQKKSPGQDQ